MKTHKLFTVPRKLKPLKAYGQFAPLDRIALAQRHKLREVGFFDKMEIPREQWTVDTLINMCWACGQPCTPQRAHIVAWSRRLCGYSEDSLRDSSNFFLLCHRCHLDQPDGMPAEYQWKWLMDRDYDINLAWKQWKELVDEIPPGILEAWEDYMEKTGIPGRVVAKKMIRIAGRITGRNSLRTFWSNIKALWCAGPPLPGVRTIPQPVKR